MSVLTKVLGDPNAREVKRHLERVADISELEPLIEKLTDDELRAKTPELRQRLENGEALDDLLVEAFSVVRDAARRTIGLRPFDVQIVGGIVLHQGKIAEMKTGEGKTLVRVLPVYLNQLESKGAYLITVTDSLARRDAGWNGPVYHALGMSVAVIGHEMSLLYDPEFLDETHPDPRLQHLRPITRAEAYQADITYGTNSGVGFDYLRDNMAVDLAQCVQRGLNFAIVDEVDSILIDEARPPLIISGQGQESTEKYYQYARLIPRLAADDYTVDEKTKSAALTEEGIAKIERWTGIKNVYELEHVDEAHQINQALKAYTLFHRDRDYLVKDGEVIIVDEFTGRQQPGRRWSDGLHQAVEAKEGVKVQQETQTLATITYQNYFRLYTKLPDRGALIVATAGQPGAVTIATNMAGRGADIVLGPGVAVGGGLHIVGTERHESRRIDNQLRGRSGRQGDPGSSRFFLALDDDLMRIFGGERIKNMMNMLRVGDDEPIESRLGAKQIESAQTKD